MSHPRKIRIDGAVAYVPLTRGYEAIIDIADVQLVCDWNWRADVDMHTVYAVRGFRTGGQANHRCYAQTDYERAKRYRGRPYQL